MSIESSAHLAGFEDVGLISSYGEVRLHGRLPRVVRPQLRDHDSRLARTQSLGSERAGGCQKQRSEPCSSRCRCSSHVVPKANRSSTAVDEQAKRGSSSGKLCQVREASDSLAQIALEQRQAKFLVLLDDLRLGFFTVEFETFLGNPSFGNAPPHGGK